MEIIAWLACVTADADARGLPELKPLLETLARATQALRDADGEFGHPAAEHGPQHTAATHPEHADDDKAPE